MHKWDIFHDKHENAFLFSLCDEKRVRADGYFEQLLALKISTAGI